MANLLVSQSGNENTKLKSNIDSASQASQLKHWSGYDQTNQTDSDACIVWMY